METDRIGNNANDKFNNNNNDNSIDNNANDNDNHSAIIIGL